MFNNLTKKINQYIMFLNIFKITIVLITVTLFPASNENHEQENAQLYYNHKNYPLNTHVGHYLHNRKYDKRIAERFHNHRLRSAHPMYLRQRHGKLANDEFKEDYDAIQEHHPIRGAYEISECNDGPSNTESKCHPGQHGHTETQMETQTEEIAFKSQITLEHALPILTKISEEIQHTKEEAIHHLRNDFQCEIDGMWTSNVGGVRLRLTTHDDGKISVILNATDAPHSGDLQDCPWHLSGLVPSKRQGPFALAAVCSIQHRIAVFLGQCKVCEDMETIFGNWMFSRIARDCSDAMIAFEIKSDVWRKDHSEDVKHEASSNGNENVTCVTPLLPPDD